MGLFDDDIGSGSGFFNDGLSADEEFFILEEYDGQEARKRAELDDMLNEHDSLLYDEEDNDDFFNEHDDDDDDDDSFFNDRDYNDDNDYDYFFDSHGRRKVANVS